MKYVKAEAKIIIFENNDIITGSNSCGHKTSGNSCSNNGTQKFDNCPNMNHSHGINQDPVVFF